MPPVLASPSVRRAWIEMIAVGKRSPSTGSPSVRRAWIEILSFQIRRYYQQVALREEGVD